MIVVSQFWCLGSIGVHIQENQVERGREGVHNSMLLMMCTLQLGWWRKSNVMEGYRMHHSISDTNCSCSYRY